MWHAAFPSPPCHSVWRRRRYNAPPGGLHVIGVRGNAHLQRGPLLRSDMHDNPTESLSVTGRHQKQILFAGEMLRNTLIEVSGEVHQGLLV